MKYLIFLFTLFPSLLNSAPSWAHSDKLGGFDAGLMHPVFGLDHFLAMVSVGIISAQMGGRATWLIPTTFVTVMALSGFAGMQDIGLIGVEQGIVFSVIVLGIAIAADRNLHMIGSMAFVGLFAVFHGYAHGLEIPSIALSWSYVLGFMIGTAGLHITGVLITYLLQKIEHGDALLRYCGAAVAGMGIHILIS